MDECVNGWLCGWIDVSLDEWYIHIWKNGRMNVWMDVFGYQMDVWIDGSMNECMDGSKGCIDKRRKGRKDAWTNG